MATKKRFIAGATCPVCSKVDTVFVLTEGKNQSRHCVECNFSEQLSDEPAPNVVGEWQPVRLSED